MHTILTVDDDILIQKALLNHVDFVRAGFDRVLTAADSKQAAEILEQEEVDVLLCDIEMPGESGLDLIRWIVEKQYPVITILLTCHSSFAYAKEAIGLDVFDYLLKPIDVATLEKRLQQALQKKNEIDWMDIFRKERTSLPDPSGSDTVSRIRRYIEDNIQTELTREQLGQALFMSPDYVARIFREKQGQSLNDYIRIRRIAHAKRLLRETDLSAADICEQIGYSYNSYFFNIFKKTTGISLNDYRNEFTKSRYPTYKNFSQRHHSIAAGCITCRLIYPDETAKAARMFPFWKHPLLHEKM